jgi:hypothetical protein
MRLEHYAQTPRVCQDAKQQAVCQRLAGVGTGLRRKIREDFACELGGIGSIHVDASERGTLLG